jgi:hypothetical protein
VSVTLRELEEYWTLDDLFAAHAALDALDEAAELAAELAEKEAKR